MFIPMWLIIIVLLIWILDQLLKGRYMDWTKKNLFIKFLAFRIPNMYLLIGAVLLALSLQGCGSKSNPSSVTTTPGTMPNQVVTSLTAMMLEPGDNSIPASVQWSYATTVTIPPSAPSNTGDNDVQNSVLTIGSVQCYYQKTFSSFIFFLTTCSQGFTAGQTVTLPSNTALSYSMTGSCSENCSSTVSVTVTE